jgi:hypothetical protein
LPDFVGPDDQIEQFGGYRFFHDGCSPKWWRVQKRCD